MCTSASLLFLMFTVNINFGDLFWVKAETWCDKSLWHVAATSCCGKSPHVTCENHCCCDRILSLRSVARIQTGLNSCNRSQWQNKRKQPCCCSSAEEAPCHSDVSHCVSRTFKCFVAFEGRNGWKTLEVPNPELTDVNSRMKRQSAKKNLVSS